MHDFRFSLCALAAGLLAAPSMAQDIFSCSQSDMILTRANDKNNNGTTNEPGEYTKCADAFGILKAGTEIKATSMFGSPALLWLENNSSASGGLVKQLVKLVDLNGDGVFDNSEIVTVVSALHTKFGASSAGNTFLGGLTIDAANNVYISNNQFVLVTPASNGIMKVAGANTPAPTTSIALKTSDAPIVDEDATNPGSGSVAMGGGGSFERLACHTGSGVIYTYHTKDDVIYALRDLNNDGKFTGAGEAVNFVNLSGHKAGLARNVDFAAGGTLATRGNDFAQVQPSASNGNYLTLLYVEVDQTTGVVWLGTRTSLQGPGSNDVTGMILRCEDLNGNGTCNDAGEVTIYVDAFNMSGSTFIIDGQQFKPSQSNTPGWCGLAVDSATGTVYAASNNGPADASGVFTNDTVWKFVDGNANGNAMDIGEQICVTIQRPAGSFLNELEVTNIGFARNFAACSNFYAPGAQSQLNLNGICTAGGVTNIKPGIRFYKNAPYLGNPDFQVSCTGVQLGSDFAQLWVSQADWNVNAVGNFFNALCSAGILCLPTPSNMQNLDEWLPFGVWNSPSPMYLDLFDLFGTGTQEVDVTTPAIGDAINGTCTNGATTNVRYIGRFDTSFAIPNDPNLKGQQFRLQWHVLDPSGSPGQPFPIPRAVSDAGIVVIE